VDISSGCGSIRKNTKASAPESVGYYELKQHKGWSDEKCSKLLDQRKRAKLQWLQNQSGTKGDSLNNVRRETSRTFQKWNGMHQLLVSADCVNVLLEACREIGLDINTKIIKYMLVSRHPIAGQSHNILTA
jgi:hypothetical protein